MSTELRAHRPDKDSWAPWWVYVLILVPANLGKELLLPGDTDWWVRTALSATILMGGIALITAIHRAR
jgi:hypothetical protein